MMAMAAMIYSGLQDLRRIRHSHFVDFVAGLLAFNSIGFSWGVYFFWGDSCLFLLFFGLNFRISWRYFWFGLLMFVLRVNGIAKA